MANESSKIVPLEGSLKDYYSIKLVVRQESTLDGRDILRIRAKLIYDSINSIHRLKLLNSSVIKLYVNDNLVAKDTVDIDTTHEDEISLIAYSAEYLLKETVKMDIRITFESIQKPEAFNITTSRILFTMQAPLNKKLFIDLDSTSDNEYIYCTFTTTLEPDFLEYKTNYSSWSKLSEKAFKIGRSEKDVWIQVRGKYNGVYSYSNVLKYKGVKI